MEDENIIELQEINCSRHARFEADQFGECCERNQNGEFPNRDAQDLGESERGNMMSTQNPVNVNGAWSPQEVSLTTLKLKNEPITFAQQKEIKFTLPVDPAPTGSECVLYLARNIACFSTQDPEGWKEGSFYGELRGERELLILNFTLTRRFGGEYFDLKITDVTRPFESHLSLARFQQAELLLQFVKPENGEITIVHEEPAFRIALDWPHWKSTSQQTWREFLHERQRSFSVLCSNVIPTKKLWETAQKHGSQHKIIMRIYFKLIQGQLDVLHGIQKCFHPDKALYNLRDVLAESLVNGQDTTDMIWVSGDNIGYKVHRAILAANSEVIMVMLRSGLSESKSGIMYTPPFITGQALKTLLKFLYARNRKDLEDNPSLTMSVLRAAHFYQMNLLVEVCEESLLAMPIEQFSLENCISIFESAELLDREAIETKIVHILLRMDVKLSSSEPYIEFLRTAPVAAAKMTEMIVQFKTAKK